VKDSRSVTSSGSAIALGRSGGASGLEIDVSDRDLHALAEQQFRGGAADAAGTARDGDGLSGKDAGLLGHGFLLLCGER
jgi:hypothetical protein